MNTHESFSSSLKTDLISWRTSFYGTYGVWDFVCSAKNRTSNAYNRRPVQNQIIRNFIRSFDTRCYSPNEIVTILKMYTKPSAYVYSRMYFINTMYARNRHENRYLTPSPNRLKIKIEKTRFLQYWTAVTATLLSF